MLAYAFLFLNEAESFMISAFNEWIKDAVASVIGVNSVPLNAKRYLV